MNEMISDDGDFEWAALLVCGILEEHVKVSASVIGRSDLKELLLDYRERRTPRDLSFNVFRLMSDIYYRENLHSDIIAAFLNPDEKHEGDHTYVHSFINWLNVLLYREGRPPLPMHDYGDVAVERESGRVDILLHDKTTGRAIIVENKIAGAVDQFRQIPRYLEYAENRNLCVDLVVYLTLNELKEPTKYGWSDEDHLKLEGKLLKARAFSEADDCMLKSWIWPSEKLTDSFNTLSIFRQYGELIENLGYKDMNEQLMKRFYDRIFDQTDLYENARSLLEMMQQLPEYRAQLLIKEFAYATGRKQPFADIWIHKSNSAVFNQEGNEGLSIDIRCYEDRYLVCFWDRRYADYGVSRVSNALEFLGRKERFELKEEDNQYIAEYRFPQEERQLYSDLEEIFRDLYENRKLWYEYEPVS